MRDKTKEKQFFDNSKTVYGPVKSWRFGQSLGIDPIFRRSTCSFNCIYCQLGHIQHITNEVKIYVETPRVLQDYRQTLEKETPPDVITYSGSGEPTLAANLGEMIAGIRRLSPDIPQFVLTNGTELVREEVLETVLNLDKIIIKLDASDEKTFQMVNRPAPGIGLRRVLDGVEKLKSRYRGDIEIQSMFMPLNLKQVEDFAALLLQIAPQTVQLNTPKRPWPTQWHRENRGNHREIYDYETKKLKTIPPDAARGLQSRLEELTGLEILSIYPQG